MKKILVSCFLFFLSQILFGKETQPASIYMKNGEKLYVDVFVYEPGIVLNTSRLKYLRDGKKESVDISLIKGLVVDRRVYKVIGVNSTIALGPNRGTKVVTIKMLCELIDNGPVKLYEGHFLNKGGFSDANGVYYAGGSYLASDYYLQNDSNTYSISWLDFKKKMEILFPNCIVLERIKDKTYKFKDLQNAVAFANENCDFSETIETEVEEAQPSSD